MPYKKKKCLDCGKEISGRSKRCNHCHLKNLWADEEYRKSMTGHKTERVECICGFCGKTFYLRPAEINHNGKNFCSHECFATSRRKRVDTVCEVCGKIFSVQLCIKKNGHGRFCSTECLAAHRNTKIEKTCITCGKVFLVFKSRAETQEVKYCSKKCMGLNTRGENHPNWNANLTCVERCDRRCITGYGEWRKAVYEKDGYTCKKCGDSKGGNLNAHHIESYNENPDLRTELSNGITLCEECHKDFHHRYGYGNNTKMQLAEFMLSGGDINS